MEQDYCPRFKIIQKQNKKQAMTYIVKADIPSCNGASCRICQDYLPGFFDKDGGIRVVTENVEIDGAEMAEQFCPMQCISMEVYNE